MHPAQIQAALKMQQITQADIAREFGISPTAVYDVIHGRSRSKRIEMRIAAITRQPLAVLWPQWHAAARKHRALSRTEIAGAMRAVAG